MGCSVIHDRVCHARLPRGLSLDAVAQRVGDISNPGSVPIMKRKSFCMALDLARLARDMMGCNGLSDEFGVARHYGQRRLLINH